VKELGSLSSRLQSDGTSLLRVNGLSIPTHKFKNPYLTNYFERLGADHLTPQVFAGMRCFTNLGQTYIARSVCEEAEEARPPEPTLQVGHCETKNTEMPFSRETEGTHSITEGGERGQDCLRYKERREIPRTPNVVGMTEKYNGEERSRTKTGTGRRAPVKKIRIGRINPLLHRPSLRRNVSSAIACDVRKIHLVARRL
jgi:hypothetical protein